MLKSGFKIKRPHSPDVIGMENYKKQRLLEDFSNLNISNTNKSKAPSISNSNVNILKTHSSILKIGKDANDINSYNDMILQKFRNELINHSLQVVVWRDYKTLIYENWLKWYISRHNDFNAYDMHDDDDEDVDIDDEDMNIDDEMDIDMDVNMQL
ncbi:hypothetical protein TPHA_0L01650 [Tetrapisispora phaffii CBS 4417]|uniref:Uncharacterized protein n=1 Tax=Tetrapisispora phaffii (strain ATCC 24235 / CBS 4417 / NBRC 1672 / NRRL Y-8282 / UCD 70-5) TaxID=1071381 RepID=G8C040_TETPH|nr:hypothetical protein TPHA_0L01650 [Tetrapisispora phaffii CBS 4417]CCE65518.1 hypothetical protein TPHA_0L01650 [Tetrapisispora phaffii CBS 4417]